MSIERQHGEQTLLCDTCGEDLGEFYTSFPLMISKAKAEGWGIKPDGSDWTHTCPDCAGSSAGGLNAQKRLFGR